jgi:hypothetical protein
MSESVRALASDLYLNLKLQVKMDLPRSRDVVFDLFERVRKQYPAISIFRKFKDELALESPPEAEFNRWIALKTNSVRTGFVNPRDLSDAYAFHRGLLEMAPFYLGITPLDVEFVELLFGFDLVVGGNHDAIVFEGLLGGSPLGGLSEIPGAEIVDCQPVMGFSIKADDEVQAHFEVKTHPTTTRREGQPEPISIYLTMRRFGHVADVKQLPAIMDQLASRGERLMDQFVIPRMLIPIRQAAGMGHGGSGGAGGRGRA